MSIRIISNEELKIKKFQLSLPTRSIVGKLYITTTDASEYSLQQSEYHITEFRVQFTFSTVGYEESFAIQNMLTLPYIKQIDITTPDKRIYCKVSGQIETYPSHIDLSLMTYINIWCDMDAWDHTTINYDLGG